MTRLYKVCVPMHGLEAVIVHDLCMHDVSIMHDSSAIIEHRSACDDRSVCANKRLQKGYKKFPLSF